MGAGKRKATSSKEFENACISHMDALFGASLRLTRNRADAEELVQDTYLKAFKSSSQFELGTNLKAWLMRILTNTFINRQRKKKYERQYAERVVAEPLYDEVLDREAREFASNPEKHVFAKFFRGQLEQALADLPEDYRLVVVLTDVQGFAYKEVAGMLEVPIGTVMSRLHRGRKLMRQALVDFAASEGIGVDKDKPASMLEYRQKAAGRDDR